MFHPDLRLLRSFVAVADERSVTRAAERLHLTQPTVSGQIKELEAELGFQLFHRTTRSITPTPEAERLLPGVRATLDAAEAMRAEAEAMQVARASRFRLGGAMYSMDFADRNALLDAFALEHPQIRFAIDNRLQSAQLPDLLSGQLDASLMLGLPVATIDPPSGYGEIVNEIQYPATLERVVLRRRRMGLLVPVSSPLAAHERVPRAALAGEEIAMLSTEHGHTVVDPIATFLTDSGAHTVQPFEGNALAVERHAERHGICAIGVGWFPTLPGLAFREVEGMDFHLEFAVVLGAGANTAARRFFAFARTWQDARAAADREAAA